MYLTHWEPKWGGVVSGSQFGDGASLGLFLTKTADDAAYDTPYNNIQYNSSTSGGNQVWTASSPILLTGTKANVYAYYPYDVANTNITAIPINVTENKDVMWATHAENINNASPTATLPMNHALSVIRFSLSKGDYSGAGSIESIKIKGDCMAKTGTLNAKDGTLTPTDGGTEIDLGATTTLTDIAQTVEQLVIPTAASGNISVTIQMDDKTFEATSPTSITPEKSKAYKFGLAFSDSKLTMSTVTIGEITEVDEGSMTPVVGGVPTITWAEAKSTDGVYGIYEGNPAVYNEAKKADEGELEGVAIIMYGRSMQISNAQVKDVTWGLTFNDVSGIVNITNCGGGVSGTYGYLPQSDGTYYSSATESNKIQQSYDQWPDPKNTGSSEWSNIQYTALGDTAGWSNSQALYYDNSSSYIGGTIKRFRNNTSVNQGYSDWFVPAAGQLAYIFLNLEKINTLLNKISGATPIPTTLNVRQWSSTEGGSEDGTYYDAWYMYFPMGYIGSAGKNNSNYVRFCRYITE